MNDKRAEINFSFPTYEGTQWDSKNHHPLIEITINSDGEIGIWVSDKSDGGVLTWCDVHIDDLRAILAVADAVRVKP